MRLVVRDVRDFQVINEDEARALVRACVINPCYEGCSTDVEQVYHTIETWLSFTRDLEQLRNTNAHKQST